MTTTFVIAIALVSTPPEIDFTGNAQEYEVNALSGEEMFKMSTKMRENELNIEASRVQKLPTWANIIDKQLNKPDVSK